MLLAVRQVIAFFLRDPLLLGKYVTAGGCAAALELTLFSLLYVRGEWPLLAANTFALGVSILFCFVMQKTWTFQDQGAAARQLRWYLFMQAISMFLNNALVLLFVGKLGWYAPVAKMVQIGLVFIWNFTFCRLVVFGRARTNSGPR